MILSIFAADKNLVAPTVIFAELAFGLFFGSLIVNAANGFQGISGKILELRPLQYLGKISYGIYVYHFNVPWLVGSRKNRAAFRVDPS